MRSDLLPSKLSAALTFVVLIFNGIVTISQANDDPLRPPAVSTNHVPTVPPQLVEQLRKYQNVRSASFNGWAPDGQGILIQTRFGNTSQLHRVYQPGGRREQVTFFDEPAGGRFLPNDEHGSLLISMSAGGNEAYQVFLRDGENGQTKLLTDGTSRNLLGPVREDGLFAIVASNKRNGRDTDLYILDPHQPQSMKLLLQTDGEYWVPVDWSPDGSTVLIKQYVSINESYPALLDVATGKKTDIPIPGGGPKKGGTKVSYGSMKFTPDGQAAYIACDANGEFLQLAHLDLKTFEYTWLTDNIPWDVEQIEISPSTGLLPQNGLVAFTTNENGASGLFFLMGQKHRRIDLPLGIIGSMDFSLDGTQLGFTHSRPEAPSDAYSLNLINSRLTRWTFSEVGGLDTSNFVSPQEIQFQSFDDRMIPAYYFKPHNASEKKPAAVLINIHGGPESQYRPYFSATDQYYLNDLDIAVIRPNVRGSRGYGKSYLLLDNGMKREDSIRDIGALLDWVAKQPELDAKRVAVYGGSYGGYMVLGSLTHYPDRILAGVDIVGLASFTTFLKNTKAYRRNLRRAEYGDERIPEMAAFFERVNPTSNVHKIRSKLLVAHGVNDPRVPFVVAEEVVAKVQAQGQKVWTVYADNEGHGFRKKANRDYLTAVIAMFLKEQLK